MNLKLRKWSFWGVGFTLKPHQWCHWDSHSYPSTSGLSETLGANSAQPHQAPFLHCLLCPCCYKAEISVTIFMFPEPLIFYLLYPWSKTLRFPPFTRNQIPQRTFSMIFINLFKIGCGGKVHVVEHLTLCPCLLFTLPLPPAVWIPDTRPSQTW